MTNQTTTFTPTEPITYNDKVYPALTLRKMKAKDLVAGDLVTGDMRKSFAILASMASVPIGVVEELDIDDFERLSEVAAPLMGKSARAAIKAAKEKTTE
jgi:hypothetical protein